MFDAKKCFSVFFAFTYLLFSVNVFAADGSKIFYDESYNKSIVSSIPYNKPSISLKASKDDFYVGDEFDVVFKLRNNPAFSSYSFEVQYDSSVIEPISASAKDCEVKYSYNSKTFNSVIDSFSVKSSIESKTDFGFSCAGFCMNGAGNLVESYDDGTLFSVRFKAISNGRSKVDLSGFNGFIFKDSKDKKLPIYVESIIVNVKGTSSNSKKNSDNIENESVKVTEDLSQQTTYENTYTSTEKIIEQTTAQNTDVSEVLNEKSVEQTTFRSADTENITESITENSEKTIAQNNIYDFVLNVPKESEEPIEFNDMSSYPWAVDSVNFLSSTGIIRGIDWRIFKPELFTSRADFMVIVKRLTGLEGPEETDFEDIDVSDYYAEAVGVITNYGLASGMTDKLFMPKENITRQEVCAILARILEKAGKIKTSNIEILDSFIDEDFISPYAREYMADLIGMGILSGNDQNKLRPVEPINRAEVCVLVKKVYDLIN